MTLDNVSEKNLEIGVDERVLIKLCDDQVKVGKRCALVLGRYHSRYFSWPIVLVAESVKLTSLGLMPPNGATQGVRQLVIL